VDSFDPTDLRLRVRSAFTLAELRRLLAGLGESEESVSAEGSTELAHRVVRVGAKQLGPRELLVRLRAEKPLFEWPELDDQDERWAGPMSLRMESPVTTEGEALEPSDTLVMTTPETAGGVSAPEAPGETDGPAAAPPSLRFASVEPEPVRRGRWPWVAAIGGLVVGLGGIAFGVGTWMGRGRVETPTASEPAVQRAPRKGTPAGRAMTLFDKALTSVGLVCDVNVDGALTVEILEMSLEACGRDEVEKLRRQREREVLEERLADARPRAPDPTPTAPTTRPRAGAPADRTAASTPLAARPSCKQVCASGRASCQSDCGKEPSDAARYGPYQACVSHCVAEESRCRLGCR
jgi:hypothetical protein